MIFTPPSLYLQTKFPAHLSTNPVIAKQFFDSLNTDNVRKTHLFNNRYENIFIAVEKIPVIKKLTEFSTDFLRTNSHLDSQKILKTGFWFNLMSPGDVTLAHTHDDDQELFSGVYYVSVPKNSGDLILDDGQQKILITPQAGHFIFFEPTLKHEVTKNLSKDNRLSIGFNFGY